MTILKKEPEIVGTVKVVVCKKCKIVESWKVILEQKGCAKCGGLEFLEIQ